MPYMVPAAAVQHRQQHGSREAVLVVMKDKERAQHIYVLCARHIRAQRPASRCVRPRAHARAAVHGARAEDHNTYMCCGCAHACALWGGAPPYPVLMMLLMGYCTATSTVCGSSSCTDITMLMMLLL